jgi:hypothetical protein
VFAFLCLSAALVFAFMVRTDAEVRRSIGAWLAIVGGVALAAFEQKIPFRPHPPRDDA